MCAVKVVIKKKKVCSVDVAGVSVEQHLQVVCMRWCDHCALYCVDALNIYGFYVLLVWPYFHFDNFCQFWWPTLNLVFWHHSMKNFQVVPNIWINTLNSSGLSASCSDLKSVTPVHNVTFTASHGHVSHVGGLFDCLHQFLGTWGV